ncbi:MAG: hypothetical protein FWH16_05510 [Oscillospiraceae bacterium]|nr:hypothetical protein [Oscillospiraceae bacterium]
MSKEKNARREEAVKKAKLKKTVIAISCASVAVIAAALLIFGMPRQGVKQKAEGVDVDLTILSGTMVYAEVYNMLSSPNDYIGKTIKAGGIYNVSFYAATNRYYHYVVVEDAASCCAQGLEFVLGDGSVYPGGYPEDQSKIEVIGVFGSYEEFGGTYYYLTVEEIITL